MELHIGNAGVGSPAVGNGNRASERASERESKSKRERDDAEFRSIWAFASLREMAEDGREVVSDQASL